MGTKFRQVKDRVQGSWPSSHVFLLGLALMPPRKNAEMLLAFYTVFSPMKLLNVPSPSGL